MIVASIDLIGGKAVQLEQGVRVVIERGDVRALAERFGRLGEVAVIDLDAALGSGDNVALIESLCAVAPCRVGGGIRDVERAKAYLRAGAARVIVGTAASSELLRQLPRDRALVAIDARAGRVATHGWNRRPPRRRWNVPLGSDLTAAVSCIPAWSATACSAAPTSRRRARCARASKAS